MRLEFLVVSVLLLLPMTAAQGEGPQVTLSDFPSEVTVNRDEPSSFTMTVTFSSDNPFDEFQPRTVEMSGHDNLPPGWSVTLSPQVFRIASGESQTVTASVVLSANAQQSETQLAIVAKVLPRNSGDPIPGISDQIDPEVTSDPAEVALLRDDSLAREVLEGMGSWVFIILGLIAVLVVVLVVVLTRGNRPAVALSSSVKQANVAPGRSVAIPIRVENLLSDESTVLFHVAPMPAGWAASLPLPELLLDGRRSEELHLVVTAPKTATPGDSARVGMSAHSARNPKRVAELVLDVRVGDTEARQAAGDTTFADQQ